MYWIRVWSLCESLIFAIRWILRNIRPRTSDSVACLVGKTAIVTGGGAGIGYETSKLLASRGCKVIIANRSDASEAISSLIKLTGNPNIHYKKLDLASLKSVRNFANQIKKEEKIIDILINNAGIPTSETRINEDGLNPVTQTNYFGPFLLTHLLLGTLKASTNGRVVFVTSGLSVFNNLTLDNLNPTNEVFGFPFEYPNSKLMNMFAAQEFANRFSKKYHVMFNCADTGTSKTSMFEKAKEQCGHSTVRCLPYLLEPIYQDVFICAQTSFHLASSEKLKEETGQSYFHCRPFSTFSKLKNKQFCDALWEKSEQLVKLSPEEWM